MLLSEEEWMDLRAYKSLVAAGATWADVAREAGCDWRTAKKYLSAGAPASPPRVGRRRPAVRMIAPFAPTIDRWLELEPRLQATVIYKRLRHEQGFTGSYQRVKIYVGEARQRICPRPVELHRRFEVLPGAQAQVDWGDEGRLDQDGGTVHVYSFHMTLSYSRDPFCCFVTSQDMASFWECHRRAFEHFGGVPQSIVYDRTKTVVKRHVGRGESVPLHREAVAFAAHYGFAIVVAPPRRPQWKGRVERQVKIVRENVLMGRRFEDVAGMDRAFSEWVPVRRGEVHRTHGELIGARALVDHAALLAIPPTPYVISERHQRSVGKDCLFSFEGSVYSVPWEKVRRRMRVELRVTATEVVVYTLEPDQKLICRHPRAAIKGSWVVDSEHWLGLAVLEAGPHCDVLHPPCDEPEMVIASRSKKANTVVARRDLASYEALIGTAS